MFKQARGRSSGFLTAVFAAGFVLATVSIWLAYVQHFKHFYEVLVIGLCLMLYVLNRDHLTDHIYRKLYKVFIVAGVIGDLLMGLVVFHLWTYHYHAWWEYVLLYLVVYPVAGIVMVQSYVFLNARIPSSSKKPKRKLSERSYGILMVAFGVATLVLALMRFTDVYRDWTSVLLYTAITLSAFVALSWASDKRHQQNLIQQLWCRPIATLAAVVGATYCNALLHELPNVHAQQWEYAHLSISRIYFAGVPVLYLAFWPLLAIIPVAAYYYVARIPAAKHLS